MPRHRSKKLQEERLLSHEEQKSGALETPKQCPVCGNDSVSPVGPNRVVHLRDGEVGPQPFAYRCGRGHVFLSARG